MYNNIESAVLNNGFTGNYFKLEIGFRQGYPLSAYLFILSIEVLANNIRYTKEIKGIIIDNREIKISLLADDMTLILQNLQSVENTITTLKPFHKCSGLKTNIEKTKAKYIGRVLEPDYFPHGLSWIKTPLETLGIHITTNPDEILNYNFKPKIATLKKKLSIWKQRSLSLKGKITIINNLALAPLIHCASLIEVLEQVIKEVNNIIQNFTWDGKTSKISEKNINTIYRQGGLKLCQFSTKVESLKLAWIKRLINPTLANWKVLPKYYFKCSNLDTYFPANH